MNKYTGQSFRFTQQGWVLDVKYTGATDAVSIPSYNVNAAECQNFDAVYRAFKLLPYFTHFGYVQDVVDAWQAEAEAQAADAADLLRTQEDARL